MFANIQYFVWVVMNPFELSMAHVSVESLICSLWLFQEVSMHDLVPPPLQTVTYYPAV